MTMKPEEIVTKMLAQESAIKRERGLSADSMLFARKSSAQERTTPGGTTASNTGRSQREKTCFHCLRRGHFKEDCYARKRGDPPAPRQTPWTETIANATIPTGVTMPTPQAVTSQVIENFWMAGVGSKQVSTVDWVVDGGCTRHICGECDMFSNYVSYPPRSDISKKSWLHPGHLMPGMPRMTNTLISCLDATPVHLVHPEAHPITS